MGTYSATFKTIKGESVRLDITASRLSDKTLTLGADPVRLKVASASTKYPALRSVELEINVLSDNPMLELFSEEMLNTKVTLTKGSVILFAGFLETSEWNMPCAPGRMQTKQLVAIDGLSAFKQKLYYGREIVSASSFLNRLRTELNRYWNVSVDYRDQTQGIWNSYFNTDVLQPSDVYAEHNISASWATYTDVINNFAMATATTVMMVGTSIHIYKIGSQDLWNNEVVESLRSTSMSVKMVNSVRTVEQSIAMYENIPTPELEHPRQVNQAIQMDGKYINFYRGDYKVWEVGQGSGSREVICGVEYADASEDLEGDCSNVTIAAPARTIEGKLHPIVPMSTVGNTTIKVKAEIHQQNYSASAFSFVPDLWNASPRYANQIGVYDCIYMYVGNKYISATNIATEDTSADLKWRTFTYDFVIPNADLISSQGMIVVGFDVDSDVTGAQYANAKSIEFIGDGYDVLPENKTIRWTASGSETSEAMSLSTPYGSRQPFAGKIVGSVAIPDAGSILAAYYANPHPLFKATVDDDGFDMLKKAKCAGYVCTLNGANWDIQNNRIDVELLAD